MTRNPRHSLITLLCGGIALVALCSFLPRQAGATDGQGHGAPFLDRKKPTLPPFQFSPDSHIQREGASQLLAASTTMLGRTELVAFPSSLGLCIENDHPRQRTRAGGCGVRQATGEHNIGIVAWGYSDKAGGPAGTTELIGQVTPSVTQLQAFFRVGGSQHRAPVLFSRVRGKLAGLLHVSPFGVFSIDIPTCIEGSQLRLRGSDDSTRSFAISPRFSQRAACDSGNGFVFRGDLSFGNLPSS